MTERERFLALVMPLIEELWDRLRTNGFEPSWLVDVAALLLLTNATVEEWVDAGAPDVELDVAHVSKAAVRKSLGALAGHLRTNGAI